MEIQIDGITKTRLTSIREWLGDDPDCSCYVLASVDRRADGVLEEFIEIGDGDAIVSTAFDITSQADAEYHLRALVKLRKAVESLEAGIRDWMQPQIINHG